MHLCPKEALLRLTTRLQSFLAARPTHAQAGSLSRKAIGMELPETYHVQCLQGARGEPSPSGNSPQSIGCHRAPPSQGAEALPCSPEMSCQGLGREQHLKSAESREGEDDGKSGKSPQKGSSGFPTDD